MTFFDTTPYAQLNVYPLAVLASYAGILDLYSDVALKVFLETEIAHRHATSAVPLPSPACGVDVGNPPVLDGFIISELS